MAKRASKRYRAANEAIDSLEALRARRGGGSVEGVSRSKFDESVDLAINLGVDPKHADQMVRGAIVLPHGTGKEMRVLVFAKGDKEKEAREAGADHVGGEDLAKKIQSERAGSNSSA